MATNQQYDEIREKYFWENFSGVKEWLPEQFDHGAAYNYLRASNPALTSLQINRLKRLNLQMKGRVVPPAPRAYDEQALYNGQVTISTLSSGDYGLFKYANRSDVRLSQNITPLPPRRITVRLLWAIGQAYSRKKTESDRRIAPDSMLNSLVLLLLDDWRNALKSFDIDFTLQRLHPYPAEVTGILSGMRWKMMLNNLTEYEDKIDDSQFEQIVKSYFKRLTHVDFLRASQQEDDRQSQHQDTAFTAWTVLCLLESDLPHFGFNTISVPLSARVIWQAVNPQLPLPDALSHIIVLNADTATGAIHRVERRMNERNLYFEHEPNITQHQPSDTDLDFALLRNQAIDTLIAMLEAKLS